MYASSSASGHDRPTPTKARQAKHHEQTRRRQRERDEVLGLVSDASSRSCGSRASTGCAFVLRKKKTNVGFFFVSTLNKEMAWQSQADASRVVGSLTRSVQRAIGKQSTMKSEKCPQCGSGVGSKVQYQQRVRNQNDCVPACYDDPADARNGWRCVEDSCGWGCDPSQNPTELCRRRCNNVKDRDRKERCNRHCREVCGE